MRNIKIIIQYDGTRYSGWQSQEHDENTIQGRLTAVLTRLLGETIELAGSGRTDAGVHALGQVANFKTRSCMSCEEILEKLEGEERQLIGLRYFQDMTQTEVANRMGVTQVQVSRMEKRILKKLREMEK